MTASLAPFGGTPATLTVTLEGLQLDASRRPVLVVGLLTPGRPGNPLGRLFQFPGLLGTLAGQHGRLVQGTQPVDEGPVILADGQVPDPVVDQADAEFVRALAEQFASARSAPTLMLPDRMAPRPSIGRYVRTICKPPSD